MTRVLLARHGDTEVAGRVLTGRAPGIHLNERGRAQALALERRLSGAPIEAVFVSPLERTHETAAPLTAARALEPVELADLTDIEFGAWSGYRISDLEGDSSWAGYNRLRGLRRPAGGESLADLQARMLRALDVITATVRRGTALVVSHGDPIKALIALVLGIPLDFVPRLEVTPAGISVIDVHDDAPRVLCINQTEVPEWAPELGGSEL